MNPVRNIKKRGEYDLYLTFFSNKVEKVVSAIYLVTEYFPKEESLKWQLRKNGLRLLSKTMSLNELTLPERDKTLSDIRITIQEVVSFLEVSLTAKIVTEMNVEVLKRELKLLLKIINDSSNQIGQVGDLSLRGDFFKVKGGDLKLEEAINKKGISVKGQSKGHSEMSFKNQITIKNKGSIRNSEKKKTRKKQILKLFNKGQKLTIKDISGVVDDCGEKTIQRELQSMMKEGLISKKGERRWSQYYLN
ncbi:MAG: hypothetical protein U9P50_01370 [Patescibacteria group bacterium]|nr:hypothetical protein [Patescibacteria group bacterium]